MGGMAKPRQPLSEISMEGLERLKRRREGSIRSLPEIRRAVRLHQPITPGEQRVLWEAMEAEREGQRDETATLDAEMTAETEGEGGPEVDAAEAQEEIEEKDLKGAAADAVKNPDDAAIELAPPGPDHEALTAHDEAAAATHKAIVAMERANGPGDKLEAVHGLYDAATKHKAVSRQLYALAGHLGEHALVGAPKARAAGKAHRDAAMAIERAAATGQRSHYEAAHSAVTKTEERAKMLSETLQEQAVKRAAKAKKDAKKVDPVAEAGKTLDRIEARRKKGASAA